MDQQNNGASSNSGIGQAQQQSYSQNSPYVKVIEMLGAQNAELQKMANDCEQRIKDTSTQIGDIQQECAELKQEQEKMASDLQKNRNSTSVYLSLFGALIAFISISINILSNVSDGIFCVGLLLIVFGALITFTSLVIIANNLSVDRKQRIGLTILLAIIGILSVLAGGILSTVRANFRGDVTIQHDQSTGVEAQDSTGDRKGSD